MKAKIKNLLVFIISFSVMNCCFAEDLNSYRVSVDDELSITVFQEPELSIGRARVSSSGRISMPLIGQVTVESLTVEEIEGKITNLLLGDYLKNPNVTVAIIEYRPFYINGEVERPGSYPYRKDLTIEKAVVLAGGFTERASKESIEVIRGGKSEVIKNLTLSSQVRPGDVITVKESFF